MRDIITQEEVANYFFEQGFDCSQVVLASFCEELGMDQETALKVSSSFGSGLWNGEVCGCVTGALMALGLKYGHYSPGDSKSKEIISSKTKEFEAKFKEKNKSIICREILGYDIGKPEEFEKIITKGILQEKCPKLAISACEILSEML